MKKHYYIIIAICIFITVLVLYNTIFRSTTFFLVGMLLADIFLIIQIILNFREGVAYEKTN